MNVAWLSLAAFLSSAVPWSLIIGKLAGASDIRVVGDHNPGATNVLRAAGIRWFIPAVLLDSLKAAIPVGLAWYFFRITGWGIVPIAAAAIAGHAFSPFLHFQGGKAVAATFGIWSGLTLALGPTLMGVLLILMVRLLANSGWAVVGMMGLFGGFVAWYFGVSAPPLLGVWAVNLLLLLWTHRQDLARPPALRPDLWRRTGGS